MKVQFIYYAFLIPLFIFGNEVEGFKQIVQKNCSQKITNFISIESNNSNICNFEYINQFPKKAQKQLKKVEDDINNLKNNKLSTINETKIQELEKESVKIREIYKLYKEIIDNMQKSINEKTLDVNYQFDKFKNKYILLDEYISNIETQIRNIQKKNEEQDKRIKEGEIKDKKQDKLFLEFKNYILNFNKINIGIDFLYPNQLDLGVSVEVKNYDTLSQSSNFIKLSTFKLTETTNYSTLGNNSESIDNDKKLYSIDFGYRKFFNSHRFINKSNTYLGASIGGTYIDDSQNKYSSFSGSLLVGLKYNNMFIGELGYKYINDISSKNIYFDGLGKNNSFYSKKNKFIPFISIKYLWR